MRRSWLPYAIILLGSALLFLPLLGQVHLFDWDEINFAECAREMIASKDYLRMQIDFAPFYEKPPLFIWMQVAAMKLFGVGEYAARFPDAMIGIITLLTIYYAGKKAVSEKLARWWTVMYAASWLPHFYFKSGIIDPVFNFFIFAAFLQVYLIRHAGRKMLHAALAGLFLGLAVLTKGPVALLISGISLTVYLVIHRGFRGYLLKHFLLIALVASLTTATWFGTEIMQHGWHFIREFLLYQAGLFGQNIADHEEPWYYHPIVLLIGCFPASLFLFQFFRKNNSVPDNPKAQDFTRWMWILFWVVLILFSIVKTKIVHYSSLCYFPITYLAALQISRIAAGKMKLQKVTLIGLSVIGCSIACIILLLPVMGAHIHVVIPYVQDAFAAANMQAEVPWSVWECAFGGIYLTGIIACIVFLKKHFSVVMPTLCILQIVMIQATILHFTPKIEAYSQRAAIEYFQSLAGKDVYVQVLGYKSYAHLFYTQKIKSENPLYYQRTKTIISPGDSIAHIESNEEWLLYEPLDKPAYFICKLPDWHNYQKLPQLQLLGAKNGFVFFKRTNYNTAAE